MSVRRHRAPARSRAVIAHLQQPSLSRYQAVFSWVRDDAPSPDKGFSKTTNAQSGFLSSRQEVAGRVWNILDSKGCSGPEILGMNSASSRAELVITRSPT